MEDNSPVLVIDFNNMVHRARSGFNRGEHSITYTFLLMFRKTIEKFAPSKVYVVKEGRPQHRHDALVEYKANRSSAGDSFWRQHGDILTMLSMMPVSIVRHPQREADDTIAHIVRVVHANDPCVVVSTDTDFIQLLKSEDMSRIRLWNPTKEEWVAPFACDYVKWKSLTGDGSDNIPGFKGVGAKTAEKLINDPKRLEEFLSAPGALEKWMKNQFLISFAPIDDDLEWTETQTNWDSLRSLLKERGFESLTGDKSWKKYTNTFNSLER